MISSENVPLTDCYVGKGLAQASRAISQVEPATEDSMIRKKTLIKCQVHPFIIVWD